MADPAEDDDELTLDTLADAPQDEETPEPQDDAQPDEGDDELTVSFGDDDAPIEGDDLVGHLRRLNRDKDKQIAELRRAVPAEKPPELGDKPSLESCGYNEEEHEKQLLAWHDRKRTIEQKKTAEAKDAEAADAAFQTKVEEFGRHREALKAPDFEDATAIVVGATTELQRRLIVRYAKNSATVLYALGKHPARLAELAKIADPVEFALAISAMEGTIRVTNKKKAPEPEGTLRGSGQLSRGKDAKLERLEREADRTGDRTLVVQYKRSLKDKAR